MFLPALCAMLLSKQFNFYPEQQYDPSVPRPESILEYKPGQKHTTFRDQERVILAITSAAKNRTKVIEYGKSPEGRPLRLIVISSPQNIAQLDKIRQDHAELATGKTVKTIPITWINECIHGDETASFETAMWTLYNLVASRGELAESLKKSVVILNPVFNPDGHERFIVYTNSISVGASNPDAFEHQEPGIIHGRLNHYRFDMNRDRIAFSQTETRAEYAQVLRWNPQAYIDQHGQVSSYFFPPEPMSVNPNVDRERNNKWVDIFGRANAKAFDEHGLRYFVKHGYDLFFPGYVDISVTLTGAIGMTHETDGGRYLAREEADGMVRTLQQGVYKHFVSALAVVKTAATRGQELLADYVKFKQDAISGRSAGTFQSVVVGAADARPLRRLQKQLQYAGIKSVLTTQSFPAEKAHDYWSNSVGAKTFNGPNLIVNIGQAQGAMAKALLEPTTEFEKTFTKLELDKLKTAPKGETYPGPDGDEFYDTTAWSLPYCHNLPAWWCEQAINVAASEPEDKKLTFASSPIGYALNYRDDDDALFALRATASGIRAMASTKPMTLADHRFEAGTFFFLAERNEEGFDKKLKDLVEKWPGVTLTPLTSAYPERNHQSPGSESMLILRKPKIGVVFGGGINLSPGISGIWWTMEQDWKLPFVPLSTQGLGHDLSSYTCLIFPGGTAVPPNVKEWAKAGGSIIVFGGTGGVADLASVKGEFRSLPGALFKAELDTRSFLSFGYGGSSPGGWPMGDGNVRRTFVAVPFAGTGFYESKLSGGSVVKLSSDAKVTKLLSGWSWPDETENEMRGVVWAQDVPLERGHAICFLEDPTERVMYPGWNKAILNAIIFGSAQ